MSICIYMNPLLNRCGIHILLGVCNLDAGRGWNSLLYELSSLLVLLPLAKKLLNLRLFSISQCRALEHFFEMELNKRPKDDRWVGSSRHLRLGLYRLLVPVPVLAMREVLITWT
jgi:hypothetical protein